MKTRLLAFAFAIAAILAVRGADQASFIDIAPPATSIAANTTNSTAGAAAQLYGGQTKCRLWVSGTGVSATTGGNLLVRLATASGTQSKTNAFDSSSSIYVSVPMKGATTETASDWFYLYGVQWVRVCSVENTAGGSVSNIAVRLGYSPNP